MDVVLQFETSGSWPDDLMAIQRIKSAFYLRMGNSLQNQASFRTSVANTFVDVMVDKFTFRLRIHHPREVLLVRAQELERAESKHLSLEAVPPPSIEVDMVHRPVHVSLIRGFSARNPVYGKSVRLVKRWLSSHLLLSLMEEEAVELLVAYLFAYPRPFAAPGSPFTALMRFLVLLSTHDWVREPIIVDISNEFDAAQIKQVKVS